MTWLPPKRKRQRSEIKRDPERVWPKHERWIRSLACSVRGCDSGATVRCHHMRTASNSGKALKPASWFCVPLCDTHHAQFHDVGIDTFRSVYGVDLFEMAALLAQRSPDTAMRQAMREAESEAAE